MALWHAMSSADLFADRRAGWRVRPITPNQITLFSVAVGLAGAPFFCLHFGRDRPLGPFCFCSTRFAWVRWRVGQAEISGISTGRHSSTIGETMSFTLPSLAAWPLAGALHRRAWPLLLGAAAIVGTLGSAGFVYWRTMRPKDDSGPLFTSVSTMTPITVFRGCSMPRLAAILSTLCLFLRCSASRTGFWFWPRQARQYFSSS